MATPLSYDEIRIQALARATEFSPNFPASTSVLLRRIVVRQAALWSRAASIAPGFATQVDVVGLSDDGLLDVQLLARPAARILTVQIEDPGTSAYPPETEVAIVSADDAAYGALPPRMLPAAGGLQAYRDDLAGVASLRVTYLGLPYADAREIVRDPTQPVELPHPHDELLVVDLTKHLATKVPQAQVAQALPALDAEEQELLAGFDAYVAEFYGATDRFAGRAASRARPAVTPK